MKMITKIFIEKKVHVPNSVIFKKAMGLANISGSISEVIRLFFWFWNFVIFYNIIFCII